MASLLNTSCFLPLTAKLQPHATLATGPRRGPTRVQAKIREIFMPALSSTMAEGKTVSWIKSEGDKLAKGESVVVVQSDKADMDVETFYDGYLAAIMVEEGAVAPVGSAIAFIAESEAEIEQARSKTQSSSSSSSKTLDTSPPPPPQQAVGFQDSTPAPAKPPLAAAEVGSSHPAAEGGRIVATPYTKKLSKDQKVEIGSGGDCPDGANCG